MKRLLVLLWLAFIPVLTGMQTTSQGDTNARIKTIFIYNFTRYIEWPPESRTGNFTILVYGPNAPLVEQLNNMAKTKMVGNQKIEIRTTNVLSAIGAPNIIFINQPSSPSLPDIISALKGKSTLIVTEKTGLAKQGAAINFLVVQNKQKFELNKNNAEKYNLKVSTTLLQLAIPVEQ
jgi:hypothetical protein